MTKMVKIRCHVCYRDPNCSCKGNCDVQVHECDCDYCGFDSNTADLDASCECICHKPVMGGTCKCCNGTKYIEYEAIGEDKA